LAALEIFYVIGSTELRIFPSLIEEMKDHSVALNLFKVL